MKSAIGNRKSAILALFLCGLLAGGCGKEETAKPKAAKAAEPPQKVTGSGLQVAGSREGPVKEAPRNPEPETHSLAGTPPTAPAPKADEFDAALGKILGLEQDAKFSEAMQLCREAGSRFRGHPKATALLEISTRLRDEKKAAPQLLFAIQKLTSARPDVVEVAQRELLQAGDASLILLRKTLRDESGDAAVEAAKLLAQARDKRAPQAFVAKLAQSPAGPLRAALCDGLKALADSTGQDVFPALYAIVKDDAAGRNWDVADILCAALAKRCGGDAAKLGELLGDPAAAGALNAYVAKAINSNDEPAANWARSVAPVVGVLVNGLRGSYFQGTNFEKLLFERLDTKIDFTDKTLPFPEGKGGAVSVRWTGYLLVEKDGNYMIASGFDGGQRLWIDGKLILEDWTEHGATEQQASVKLLKGFHEIKLEYMNGKGEARIHLSWDGPGFTRRVIAADALRTLPWKGMQKPGAPN